MSCQINFIRIKKLWNIFLQICVDNLEFCHAMSSGSCIIKVFRIKRSKTKKVIIVTS